MAKGMSFDNSLRCLKAKFDYITLKVQLDTVTNMVEQKQNVNTFNFNYVICDLFEGYHAIYECMQVQNVDYYDKFGYYNSCFWSIQP